MLTTVIAVAVMALDGGQPDGGVQPTRSLSLKDVRAGAADAPLGVRLSNVGYLPPLSWSLDGGM